MSHFLSSAHSLTGIVISGILPLLKHRGLRIVYYHTISDFNLPYYWPEKQINQDVLVKQIRFLKKRYEFISLSRAIDIAQSGESLNGFCVFTTDDGFQCNFSQIAPILIEFNIKPTFFLISDCIDNNRLMWRNMLYMIEQNFLKEEYHIRINDVAADAGLSFIKSGESLLQWSQRTWRMSEKEYLADYLWDMFDMPIMKDFLKSEKPYLSSKQIRQLADEGFEFGVHSKTHPYFSKLGFEEFKMELDTCVDKLTMVLPEINYPLSFAYPFGDRVTNDFETRYLNSTKSISAFLGIKRGIKNSKNPIEWERDKLELPYFQSITQLYFYPIIRHLMR